MKNVLDWIKSNPISAVSVVVALISMVITLYWVTGPVAAFRAKVTQENSSQAGDLKSLTSGSVDLPNPDPDEPPIAIKDLVINEQVIRYVGEVYERVSRQAQEINRSTEEINASAHRGVMLAGQRVFGNASTPSAADFLAAAEDYGSSFLAMFAGGHNHLGMPRVMVGLPPTRAEAEAELDQARLEYLNSVGAESTSGLTQAQGEELYQLQRAALLGLLTDRASGISLYADVLPVVVEAEGAPGGTVNSFSLSGAQQYGPDYPFKIADWAYAAEQPALDELWEGQVQLWIIRDIMTTIAQANSRQVPRADGSVEFEPLNVMQAPIKRLIRLDVVDGYVGLHSGGGIHAAGGRGGGAMGGGAAASAVGDKEVSTVYPAPALASLPTEEQPVIDSFYFGPTGRFSNSIFDVRHVRLTLHASWESLPMFFEQLRQTNFMTVIDMQCTDVDEYDALASGYVYGQDDVVELQLVIETLWFRSWTTELMPQMVRDALAVPSDPLAQP